MQQQKQNDTTLDVRYSFDENIFGSNDFYSKIIFDDHDIFVLEDINNIIHKNSNEDYSNAINKFLSVTDGLVSKKQKIIISTNIESKTQLYPALIRPGRCYDVVKFRKLQGEEIDNLCDSCAKDLDLQIDTINASEFFAKCDGEQNSKLVNNKIGF
jgi:ATP-dependent 26S proteasome regulatory subunit